MNDRTKPSSVVHNHICIAYLYFQYLTNI